MATFSLLFGLFFMLVIQGCLMGTTTSPPLTTVTDVDAVSNAKSDLEIGFSSGDSASNVTANLELVTTGANGVTITWMSDNESVISTMGQVTRPTTGGNVIVTLTATLTKGSVQKTKMFTVTVLASNQVDHYQPPGLDWKLIWSDEFNGSSIDSTIWTHEIGQHGWGNGELQNYTDSPNNSYLQDGKLVIKAIHHGGTSDQVGSYTSARLISEGKFSFKYGLVVARMKAPYGRGLWPAIWMLGGQNNNDIGWPYDWPQCGEIDIFEMFGGQGDEEVSYRRTTGALHWDQNGHRYEADGFTHTERLANDFNYYSVEWNDRQLIWRFNGQIFQTQDITNSEQDEFRATNFFFLLNIAVGGHPVPDPDTSVFPQTMEIDWIRIYTNTNTNYMKGTIGPIDENNSNKGPRKIFADANSLSNVQQISFEGTVKQDSPNGAGVLSLTYSNNGGANNSSEYIVFTENSDNAAGDWAILFWTFMEPYNMESNIALSFYVRSSQLGRIRAKLEDVAGGGMAGDHEVEKTFTINGGWQKVTFVSSEFPATDLTQIKKVVLIVPVGESTSALTMDFDEIRFEVQ